MNKAWFQYFVYGANKGVDRRILWDRLRLVKSQVSQEPWRL
jgi:hypothetical protein